MKSQFWYQKSYRRNLVDMHIEDWDEKFLSQFDPETYVKMLKIAEVKSALVYANSHVGYCYWPTKTGHMHRGIKGRDTLGDVIDLCHKEGMEVIIYYSLIFNNWAYEQHTEWRILNLNGKGSREQTGRTAHLHKGRYGVCCPNSPSYRKFVSDQIGELCRNYDFEGIWFDMTFWPAVCYCPNCKKRYKQEVGEDLPTIVNWDDPSWVRFQEKREEWIADFAAVATSTIRKSKPKIVVEHQYSPAVLPWTFGVTSLLAAHCDLVAGDFYGGALQQSFICKLYYNLTPKMPFEFMTSICYSTLGEHTTIKPKKLIENRAFLAIAHNGTFTIIDAIDPIGTQEENRYRIIGDVFKEVKKYEKYLGGELCQDIAVYFSFDSKMDPATNGTKLLEEFWEEDIFSKMPHLDATLGATEALRTNHIPFGVITKKNLKDLSRYQAVILPNVLRFSDEEADAVKEYVAAGGNVYASKLTLKSKLSEILGATSIEETLEKYTYIAPTSKGKTLLTQITDEHPLSIPDSQVKAEFSTKDGVLATITLPYTNPDDSSKFASIHSDPPGIATRYPAMISRDFGKGRIIWSSASIETYATEYLKHRTIFTQIIKSLVRKPLSFEATAPACVEILEFHKPDEKRYLINIVNFQSEIGMPNIPINDIELRVYARKPLKVTSLPEETRIPFKQDGEYVNIRVPALSTFRMLALDYE